jgi:hypothetical protein
LLADLRAAIGRLSTAAGAMPAYVDDKTLHQLVAPHMGRDSFSAALKSQEPKGFPQVNSLWRGRYWPKCKAWLDDAEGMAANEPTATAEDGQEDFDAAPGRKARTQDRPQQSPLLDREERGPGDAGLSGSVHRLADRRKRR